MMAHNKIRERLQGIPQEELNRAQARLDELCDKHSMTRIPLTHGKAKWRELCFRMIGLPPVVSKDAYRPPMMDQEEKDYFFGYMDIIDEFSVFDEDSDGSVKTTTIDEKITLFTKKNPPSDQITKDSNQTFKGTDRLKNLWKNFGNKRLKTLREEGLKARQEEDWPA